MKKYVLITVVMVTLVAIAGIERAKADEAFNQVLTMSEADHFKNELMKCWAVPAASKDAPNSQVTLDIVMNRDGTVLNVELFNDVSRYNADPSYRKLVHSAIDAVTACSPIKSLPPEKYSAWHDMKVRFDPMYILK